LICLESFNGIDSLEDPDKIKKLVGGAETRAIIEFVKKHPGTNSDKIVKELQEKHISSRITTLSALETLLKLGIIEDERMGRYSRKLKYNENYNWEELAISLLSSSFQEAANAYQKFHAELFEDHETEKLVNEVLRKMNETYREILARKKLEARDVYARKPRQKLSNAEKLV
jgi:hypothetical protein